ncbi:hypothetical protein PoB_004268500 [Plakobranchus ocellatus]|uniref:Uncharacterized protein n=1 Tax=Plakobranchus ocellatus TaxID=259542 RepID=A0AAV4B6G8_9GAST|nr:hypothetical protein PoB_004268500 [Plakobranchus ocellatus]
MGAGSSSQPIVKTCVHVTKVGMASSQKSPCRAPSGQCSHNLLGCLTKPVTTRRPSQATTVADAAEDDIRSFITNTR